MIGRIYVYVVKNATNEKGQKISMAYVIRGILSQNDGLDDLLLLLLIIILGVIWGILKI